MKINRKRRGTSLIEVMVGVGAVTISIGGLAMSVLSSQRSSWDMRQRDMVRTQSIKVMERLLALPFGGAGDTILAANSNAVAQLFDDDTSVVNAGGVTLNALRTPLNAAGWRFQVGGFEPGGVWEVEINNDLDGNGVVNGVRGTQMPTAGDASPAGDGSSVTALLSEGRADLYRLEVFYNGQSVAKTFRSADE